MMTQQMKPNENESFFRRCLTKCRKSTIGFFVVLVSIPLILLGRTGMARLAASHHVEIPPASPVPVKALQIAETRVHPGKHFSGVVAELRKAELSFRVGGTVEQLKQIEGAGGKMRDLHEGDKLPAGTVLAHLDPSDYIRERDVAAERLKTTQARLKQAQADAEEAEATFERTVKLVAKRAMAEASLDEAKARRLSTQASIVVAERDITTAEIQLKQAEENLAYCTLSAPFPETTIARRSVDAHQRVPAGQMAFVVHDISSVVVGFAVQDYLLPRIKIGDVLTITADGLLDQKFQGVVHKIATTANERSRSYPVEVRIDQPGGLRPGMVATVHIQREQSAILLPMTAIVPIGDGQPGIFKIVAESDNAKLERVPVAISDVFDNQVAIQLPTGDTAALKLGDKVVSTGVHRLYDGQSVKVVP